MKPTLEQHNEFLAHKLLPGVVFEHNESVLDQAGCHAGDACSIVGVVELGNDTLYLVEPGAGMDIHARQSQLRAADA